MINNIKSAVIILIFVAIIGWVLPIQSTTGTQWIVNNTNLAPSFAGETPGINTRGANNTTYWANDSAIQLLVWGHAASSGQTAEIHLYINGTKVADTSGRTIGPAEESNKTIVATIPQYANYSVEVVNAHHYEWREYQILTGQVTTNFTGTGTFTQTPPCGYNISGTQYTYLCQSPTSVAIEAVDTSTGAQTQLSFNKDYIDMNHNNGTATEFFMGNTGFTFWSGVAGDQKINLNDILNITTDVNMSSYNLTLINNINTTGTTYGVNLSYSGGIGAFGFSDNPSLNQSNFRAMSGRTFIGNNNYLGQYKNVGYVFSLTAYDALSASYSARGFRIRYFPESSTSATTVMISNEVETSFSLGNVSVDSGNLTVRSGNISLTKPGSGFNMTSSNGADWCVTITNAGTLTVSSSPCT